MSKPTPLVLLHGVPDTAALWQPLRQALPAREGPVFTPALPGFASPLPEGFGCTKDDYAHWFVGQLESIAAEHGPVDLVGHDWGALISKRAMCLRPDLIRSWVLSGAVAQRGYRGHTIALLWRIPIVGELLISLGSSSWVARLLERQGMPSALAGIEAAARSPEMDRAILKLYRSVGGLSILEDWLEDLPKMPKPGLILWGSKDPYVPQRYAEAFARERNVPFAASPSAGHWVVAQDPAWFARQLTEFWERLSG